MKRPPMAKYQKNQHCENDRDTKTNSQIQCISNKNSHAILYRNRQKFLKFIWKDEKSQVTKVFQNKLTLLHLHYFYKYSASFISFAVIKYTDESTLWRKEIYFYPQFQVIVHYNMKVTVVRAW